MAGPQVNQEGNSGEWLPILVSIVMTELVYRGARCELMWCTMQ